MTSKASGLAVLDAIDGSGESMVIRELARALDISPSIAQRLANTLVEAGYLQQIVETRRYRLGYGALAMTPLSRTIRDLEDQLGVQLFVRMPRKLRLMPAGAKYIRWRPTTSEVLRQVDRASAVTFILNGRAIAAHESELLASAQRAAGNREFAGAPTVHGARNRVRDIRTQRDGQR